jgi:hypothetical protein
MSRFERKSLFLALCLSLTALLPIAAPRPAAASDPVAERTAEPLPGAAEPSEIRLVPRLGPAERERLTREEESRRAALRPRIALWCGAYAPLAQPLHVALAEALDSLGRGWGPDSRHLGYPVHMALLPVAALPPLPDPLLDRQLRRALGALARGAEACGKGMAMTTLLRFAEGSRELAGLESELSVSSPLCVFPGGQRSLEQLVGPVAARQPKCPGAKCDVIVVSERWEAGAAPGSATAPRSQEVAQTGSPAPSSGDLEPARSRRVGANRKGARQNAPRHGRPPVKCSRG